MRFHETRTIEARVQRGLRALSAFIDALGTGQLDIAQGFTSENFSWFGRVISPQSWRSQQAREHHHRISLWVSSPRLVPASIVRALSEHDARELFGGALDPQDTIYLADVTREGQVVTLGAVIADLQGAAHILRVFDPLPLRRALEGIGA